MAKLLLGGCSHLGPSTWLITSKVRTRRSRADREEVTQMQDDEVDFSLEDVEGPEEALKQQGDAIDM